MLLLLTALTAKALPSAVPATGPRYPPVGEVLEVIHPVAGATD
ncbi:hypothetical protein ABZS86_22550 [Streptomyces sp. NPDC005355]